MKHRKVIMLPAVLAVSAIVAAGCGFSGAAAGTERNGIEESQSFGEDGEIRRETESGQELSEHLGTTDFSEIEYTRYDVSAMQSARKKVMDAVSAKKPPEEVMQLFASVEKESRKMELCYEIASVKNAIDATDRYYMDELSYITSAYHAEFDEVCRLAQTILGEEAYAAIARENWDPEALELYQEYTPMTEEQLDLSEKEQSLLNRYNEAAVDSYTVSVNGNEYGLGELSGAYQDGKIDYSQYSAAYKECLGKMNETLGNIFVELVACRQKIARAEGFESYAEYCYQKKFKRDYSVDEAQQFCDEVKLVLAEPYSRFSDFAYYRIDVDCLDEFGKKDTGEQLDLVRGYLAEVDPVLERNFQYMMDYHLYDIDYSPQKTEGGFTTYLPIVEEPFFYNQPGQNFYDIMTIIHEFGHFNSFCINAESASIAQNLDLAEIASQALELLYTDFYPDMLGNRNVGEDAELYTLDQKAGAVIEGCMYDEFQRRIYDINEPTLSQINEIYTQVYAEYYPGEISPEEQYWVLVPHNFESPLYYISYAVSAMPALEIWQIQQNDFAKAAEVYMKLVREGERGGYKETLEKVGLKTPFEQSSLDAIALLLEDYTDGKEE